MSTTPDTRPDTARKRPFNQHGGLTLVPLPGYGVKRRKSSHDSALRSLFGDLDALRGATALNLDDEIATGGTNIDGARALERDHGAARVFSVVTHGVLCGPAAERFGAPDCPVDRVFVTDTIPLEHHEALAPLVASGRLDVTEWVEELAVILYHHHWNLSIREMRRASRRRGSFR